MRLAQFIKEHASEIIHEWESFARTLVIADKHMPPISLRDHIAEILAFIATDLETAQSPAEQVEKSHGEKQNKPYPTAAEIHASLRFDGGFDMGQMVSEYRALRASVVKLWEAATPAITLQDLKDITRFHEAIDQALTESIDDYSRKLDLSRNLFLGILSHDLRNPLGAISMSAELSMKIGETSDRQRMLQAQISDSAKRASEIVDTLLDLTRSRLGTGLPIVRERMDMRMVGHSLIAEMRALHPKREFLLKISGDVTGTWDKARIGQVFSNLMSNAVQYGFLCTPVQVTVEGTPKEVVLAVHNEGKPIAPDTLSGIFSALTRAQPDDSKSNPSATNLGLGLYITKQIVKAHGGCITVTSTELDGTKFTVLFPRTTDVVLI